MMKSINKKLLGMFLFMLTSTASHAAFIDYPVPPEYSFTGSLEITGTGIGPVPIDLYPASGDFSFTYLDKVGTGFNSSIYTTPGIYNFDSTPDSVFPDVVNLSMTLNAGQIGLRTFIDWNQNIFDVLSVWDVTTIGDTTYLTATDVDGDGVRGFSMVSGPFAGNNITIDATIVTPIPAAAWLFGSGLIALAGFARRKKQ